MSYNILDDYEEFSVGAYLEGGGQELFTLTDRSSSLDVVDLPTAFPSLADPETEYEALIVNGEPLPTVFAGFGYGPDLIGDPSASTGGFAQFITEDEFNSAVLPAQAAAPEPASWTLMLLGFGALGGANRHRRRQLSVLS